MSNVDTFFSDLNQFRASLRKETHAIEIPEINQIVYVMRETTAERIEWGEKEGVDGNDIFTSQLWRLITRFKDSSGNDLFKAADEKEKAFQMLGCLPSGVIDRIAVAINDYDMEINKIDYKDKVGNSEEADSQESA